MYLLRLSCHGGQAKARLSIVLTMSILRAGALTLDKYSNQPRPVLIHHKRLTMDAEILRRVLEACDCEEATAFLLSTRRVSLPG
jgi:hypothetical protein